MASSNLEQVLEVFIRPDLTPWKIKKADASIESFDALTLIESFIESDLDFIAATRLFDKVISRIPKYPAELTHQDLHAIVVDCLLDFEDGRRLQWLQNYDNIFGPDFEAMTADKGYVSARSASTLKRVIVEQMCETVHAPTQQDLERAIGRDALDAATNRVLKIIRYCGFYKVHEEFLRAFCAELATSSVKQLIPAPMRGASFAQDRLEDSEMQLSLARRCQAHDPRKAHTFVQMSLEAVGEALVSNYNILPRPGTLECFAQFTELLTDGGRFALASPALRRAHPAA